MKRSLRRCMYKTKRHQKAGKVFSRLVKFGTFSSGATHIPQHLPIPPPSCRCHLDQHILSVVVRSGGLRVQHKWYGEQPFDPFDELVPTVRLERVFDSIACCHLVSDRRIVLVCRARIEVKGCWGRWRFSPASAGNTTALGPRHKGCREHQDDNTVETCNQSWAYLIYLLHTC